MPTKPKKRAMSSDHKAALAEGRNQARAVGNYLEALEANKPKRGRPRTVDSVKKRLDYGRAGAEERDRPHPAVAAPGAPRPRSRAGGPSGRRRRHQRAREGIREGCEALFGPQGHLVWRVARVRRLPRSPQESRHHSGRLIQAVWRSSHVTTFVITRRFDRAQFVDQVGVAAPRHRVAPEHRGRA